jgi:hypothetical protein
MSSRDGVVVRADVRTDGGVSPNRKIPLVTCEIRLFWPDAAPQDHIDEAILLALGKVVLAAAEKRAERARTGADNVWLIPPDDWEPPGQ